jgi:hypothetical protein
MVVSHDSAGVWPPDSSGGGWMGQRNPSEPQRGADVWPKVEAM